MLSSILLAAGLWCANLPGGTDIPYTDSLSSATVTADRGAVVSRTDTLSTSNSFSLAEILLQNPSLHIGDNGGYSGLKTVSLRGMGSAHTMIYIDGVRVGNLQSGQNDLGMLGLDDFESAVVDYAQNSVSFNTARPKFGNLPVAASVRMSAGSFGTWLPSARLDFRLSDNLSLSANASGVVSRGNYPLPDGTERSNNDVRQVRGGVDLFGVLSGGDYHLKAYYNESDRGTPGSVDWPSDDRQRDRNAYLQGSLRKMFTPVYSLHMSAKGSYDDIYYTSAWGDSRYGQTELQLNTSHYFRVTDWWNVSFAADLQWDGLKSTSYGASRLTVVSAVASTFRTDRLSADIAVEYNGTFDRGEEGRSAFSPSADVRFTVMDGLDIVGFARRAYRMPTFNELYYVGYGNPELKPEDALLTDLGLDFRRKVGPDWVLYAKIDGFFNLLSNKIISAPTVEDPAVWRPYNIGKVCSIGSDVSGGISYASGDWIIKTDARYSFQNAVDRTPDSSTYDVQIPYVARHNLVLNASAAWKGWIIATIWQLRAGRTDGYGDLPAWNTSDLNFIKSFTFGSYGSLTLRLSVKNIFDERYESVSGYPMPGRSIIGGVEYRF